MTKTFETASFHVVKPCNMRCKFCYATFEDMRVIQQLPEKEAFLILDKLKEAGLEKITFAGGEPLLYKHLPNVIRYSKQIGLTTSIITNGWFLTNGFLSLMKNDLDWIGVSIDSIDAKTNVKIGRVHKNFTMDYYSLIERIKRHGYKLKINTVVNRFNEKESMQGFIDFANPSRWKIFDTLRVEGQNDKQFEEIRTTKREEGYEGFKHFVERHSHPSMVVENNEAMTGSYLLIDPQGRLFENSQGKHTYSSKLQDNDIDLCLSEINLNREMFIKRGGIYEW